MSASGAGNRRGLAAPVGLPLASVVTGAKDALPTASG
jgi:hypothetical protein